MTTAVEMLGRGSYWLQVCASGVSSFAQYVRRREQAAVGHVAINGLGQPQEPVGQRTIRQEPPEWQKWTPAP